MSWNSGPMLDENDPVALYFGPNLRELADPIGEDGRCGAAHPADPDPCTGAPVVMVLDAENHGARGCEHHGARLLASLLGGRVYSLPGAEGAAIDVFKAAATLRPFCWLEGPRKDQVCGRCRKPFDPTDTRFDGRARYGETPWCRSCVDNCHESQVEHACPVCDPARR